MVEPSLDSLYHMGISFCTIEERDLSGNSFRFFYGKQTMKNEPLGLVGSS